MTYASSVVQTLRSLHPIGKMFTVHTRTSVLFNFRLMALMFPVGHRNKIDHDVSNSSLLRSRDYWGSGKQDLIKYVACSCSVDDGVILFVLVAIGVNWLLNDDSGFRFHDAVGSSLL